MSENIIFLHQQNSGACLAIRSGWWPTLNHRTGKERGQLYASLCHEFPSGTVLLLKRDISLPCSVPHMRHIPTLFCYSQETYPYPVLFLTWYIWHIPTLFCSSHETYPYPVLFLTWDISLPCSVPHMRHIPTFSVPHMRHIPAHCVAFSIPRWSAPANMTTRLSEGYRQFDTAGSGTVWLGSVSGIVFPDPTWLIEYLFKQILLFLRKRGNSWLITAVALLCKALLWYLIETFVCFNEITGSFKNLFRQIKYRFKRLKTLTESVCKPENIDQKAAYSQIRNTSHPSPQNSKLVSIWCFPYSASLKTLQF